MYARLTTFRVKPDRMEDLRRWREENQARIYAQPGLRQWISLADQSGEVFVIAIFDDEQAAQAALPQARAMWGEMLPMIEGEPTVRFVEVIAAENIAARGSAAA